MHHEQDVRRRPHPWRHRSNPRGDGRDGGYNRQYLQHNHRPGPKLYMPRLQQRQPMQTHCLRTTTSLHNHYRLILNLHRSSTTYSKPPNTSNTNSHSSPPNSVKSSPKPPYQRPPSPPPLRLPTGKKSLVTVPYALWNLSPRTRRLCGVKLLVGTISINIVLNSGPRARSG